MSPSHILVTRPEPQASVLVRMLQETGLRVLKWPILRFRSKDPGIDFHRAWNKAGRRLAVFSSTRAVEFGLEQLPGGFLEGVEIAAIGPATALALEAAGHPPTVVPDDGYDSEALLGHPVLQGHPGSALLLTAPGGRQMLYTSLLERNWKARFAFVYEGEFVEPDPEVVSEIAGAHAVISTWTSGKALQHAAAHLDANAWAKLAEGEFVVISPRLADLASRYSKMEPIIASGPGNPEIVRAIQELLAN